MRKPPQEPETADEAAIADAPKRMKKVAEGPLPTENAPLPPQNTPGHRVGAENPEGLTGLPHGD